MNYECKECGTWFNTSEAPFDVADDGWITIYCPRCGSERVSPMREEE